MSGKVCVEVTYDENDELVAMYLRLAKGKVYETKKLTQGVVVDLGKDGSLIGVEMLEPGNLTMRDIEKLARKYKASRLLHFKPKQFVAAFA